MSDVNCNKSSCCLLLQVLDTYNFIPLEKGTDGSLCSILS